MRSLRWRYYRDSGYWVNTDTPEVTAPNQSAQSHNYFNGLAGRPACAHSPRGELCVPKGPTLTPLVVCVPKSFKSEATKLMEQNRPSQVLPNHIRFPVNEAQAGPRLSGNALLPKLPATQQFPNPIKVGSSAMWPPSWTGAAEPEPPNGLNLSSSNIPVDYKDGHKAPSRPAPRTAQAVVHSAAVDPILKDALNTRLPWPHECVLRTTPAACRMRNNRRVGAGGHIDWDTEAHRDIDGDGRVSLDEKEIFERGSVRSRGAVVRGETTHHPREILRLTQILSKADFGKRCQPHTDAFFTMASRQPRTYRRLMQSIKGNDMGDKHRRSLTCEPSSYVGSPGGSRQGIVSEPNLAVPRPFGETEKRQANPEWMRMASRLSSDARVEAKSPLKEHAGRKAEKNEEEIESPGVHAYPASTCVNTGVDLRKRESRDEVPLDQRPAWDVRARAHR